MCAFVPILKGKKETHDTFFHESPKCKCDSNRTYRFCSCSSHFGSVVSSIILHGSIYDSTTETLRILTIPSPTLLSLDLSPCLKELQHKFLPLILLRGNLHQEHHHDPCLANLLGTKHNILNTSNLSDRNSRTCKESS